jgi:hypothetical protein
MMNDLCAVAGSEARPNALAAPLIWSSRRISNLALRARQGSSGIRYSVCGIAFPLCSINVVFRLARPRAAKSSSREQTWPPFYYCVAQPTYPCFSVLGLKFFAD